jgi:hypothetical protein
MLHLNVTVKKPDGSDLVAATPVSCVNNLLNSLFRTCEVTIGSTTLPCSQNAHPYVQYLYSLLSYSDAAQNTALQPSLWFRDTAGSFDSVVATDNPNDGFVNRNAWVMNGPIDLAGPLQIDLAKMSKLLLHQLNVTIRLYRSSPQFVLLTNEADNAKVYQVQINQAELLVRRVSDDAQWIFAVAAIASSVSGKAAKRRSRVDC